VGKNVGSASKPALVACFQSGRYGHRIRHYGLLANGGRAENIAKARALLAVMPVTKVSASENPQKAEIDGPRVSPRPCPCSGGRMIVVEIFAGSSKPKYRSWAMAPVWIDTS